jgi:small nuclear ribonucleoprotein
MVDKSRPLDVLNKSLDKRVLVCLKGQKEYRGTLDSYDQYMNVVLRDVEELANDEIKRTLQMSVIRGDNILYISP